MAPCEFVFNFLEMGQKKSREIICKLLPTSNRNNAAAGASTDTQAPAVDETSLPDAITANILFELEPLVDEFTEAWRYDAKTVLKRVAWSPAAAAMRLVRERTLIPVPRVIKAIENPNEGIGYIVMEYIDGEPLDKAWETYDEAQKSNVIDQLRWHIEDLRAIQGDFIGSVDRTVCNDQIFANRTFEYGSCQDADAFRAAKSLRACDANPAFTEMVIGMIDALPNNRGIVLTHGDLVPRNIFVREGSVVAILDWEMASFYPEYWEYVKAHLFADYEHPWMIEKVSDKFLKPYHVELGIFLHTPNIFMY